MPEKTHRICTFKFENGSEIHVAVRAMFDDDSKERSFDAIQHEAEATAWSGDETIERGRLVSFTVGPYVIIGA